MQQDIFFCGDAPVFDIFKWHLQAGLQVSISKSRNMKQTDSLSHNNIVYTSIPFVFFVGKAFTSSQRPRPTSPFSTDSNTSAALSQSQRPRPTKKHKGGRMDQQPALPHRRDGMTDGRCHPFSLVSSLKRCAMCNHLFRLKQLWQIRHRLIL